MRSYEKNVSHYIVAHTYFRPYGISSFSTSDNLRIAKMAEQASQGCRYALNCFSKLLYPSASNKPMRQPDLYRPLTFVTIEGAKPTTDKAQTIHFNIALGNLPKAITTDDILTLFAHAWHDKAGFSNNIWIAENQSTQHQTWFGYIVKEAQQAPHKAISTHGVWDIQNCWIPHAALNAD